MLDRKVKISAVRYANTFPFLYGMEATGFGNEADITTDHPSDCAKKLINGSVDIGLVPIASLVQLPDYRIITDFCLGAYGKVKTVMLLANCPFESISTIYLDYRSMSSVTLVKILARNSWKKEFVWKTTTNGFDFLGIREKEAVVLIGDQCFELSPQFKHGIDLAQEWYNFTGLPFAFACWVANKEIDKNFLYSFNEALSFGVDNIVEVVAKYGQTGIIRGEELYSYLTENMDFRLDSDKRKAIDLFLRYMKAL